VPDHFDHGTDVILDLEDYEPKPMRQALRGGSAWGDMVENGRNQAGDLLRSGSDSAGLLIRHG